MDNLPTIADYLRGISHTHSNLVMDLGYRVDEALADGQAPPPDAVAELQRALLLFAGFSQQLTDTATLASGEALNIQQRPVDLVTLLREVRELIALRFTRIPSVLTIEDEPATIVGDADRLRRVLYVIIENAHGFTAYAREDAGAVSVAVRCADGQVFVDVRDNGPGVAEALINQVGAPGVQTLNIWMREAGVIIDKIVLTQSATALTNGDTSAGPVESERGAAVESVAPTTTTPVITGAVPVTTTGTTIQAEDYQLIVGEGATWQVVISPTGTGVVAQPSTGESSTALVYYLEITTPGYYIITIRAKAAPPSIASDERAASDEAGVYMTANGSLAGMINGFGTEYAWQGMTDDSGEAVAVYFGTAGIHEIGLQMRDALDIDALHIEASTEVVQPDSMVYQYLPMIIR